MKLATVKSGSSPAFRSRKAFATHRWLLVLPVSSPYSLVQDDPSVELGRVQARLSSVPNHDSVSYRDSLMGQQR
jgi:hypothetical protein